MTPTPFAIRLSRRGVGFACCAVLLLAVAALNSPSAALAVAECPNEAIRNLGSSNVSPATGQPFDATLPECRAYEMVSPPYKQSNGARLSNASVSASGNAAAWASLGLFAGAEASNNGSTYLSTRTGLGWSTVSTNPPFSVVGSYLGTLPQVSADRLRSAVCGRLAPSTGVGEEATRPLACAVRNPDGSWTATPGYTAVNNYANGPTIAFPGMRGFSSDLSHVVFLDEAGVRLLAADTATGTTKTLYEVAGLGGPSPELRLVNLDNSGNLIGPSTDADLGSPGGFAAVEYQAVSDDGSTIYFTATPTGGVPTLYARVDGATTITISDPPLAECTSCDPTARPGAFRGASADGRLAFFSTDQQLLDSDTDATSDLYRYDIQAPLGQRIVQVSGGGAGDPSPGSGAEVQGVVQTSKTGTHAYFIAKGVLTNLPNGLGQTATAGAANLYDFERDAAFPAGRTRFVATVPGAEVTALTAVAAGRSSRSQATPDGRYLVFATAAALEPGDLDTATDIYRYDSETGDLIRLSVGEPGYPASNNGNTPGMNAVIEGTNRGGGSAPGNEGAAISADGSSVIFTTPEKLQAEDNGVGSSASVCGINETESAAAGCDVYLWHAGAVAMVSDGQRPGTFGTAATAGRISPSGEDVMFVTSTQLVPQDSDDQNDIYDARVGGGFPYAPLPPACSDNVGCHGSPLTQPTPGLPGSLGFSGPGTPPVPPAKRPPKKHKNQHHKHQKKKHHDKRRHHGRAAR